MFSENSVVTEVSYSSMHSALRSMGFYYTSSLSLLSFFLSSLSLLSLSICFVTFCTIFLSYPLVLPLFLMYLALCSMLQIDEDTNIHSVASTLKLYLRSLPDPLMTSQLYSDFMTVVNIVVMSVHDVLFLLLMGCLWPIFFTLTILILGQRYILPSNYFDQDEDTRLGQLHHVMNQLPRINYKILHALLLHLEAVQKNQVASFSHQ
jgi:hypothetical protein